MLMKYQIFGNLPAGDNLTSGGVMPFADLGSKSGGLRGLGGSLVLLGRSLKDARWMTGEPPLTVTLRTLSSRETVKSPTSEVPWKTSLSSVSTS